LATNHLRFEKDDQTDTLTDVDERVPQTLP
jgi:hypothetical protein